MAEPSFLFTPEEAQSVARRVILALEAQGYQCVVEQSVGTDAPFVPTLTAKKSRSPQRCIETQADTHYTGSMKALRNWMWSERFYGTLSICTSDTSTIAARTLHELKRDGVGLSIVAPDGTVSETIAPLVPALQVHLDPNLPLGRRKAKVKQLVVQFNSGDRKGALRDLFELTEGETRKLAEEASRKGRLILTTTQVAGADWSSHINSLASTNQCVNQTVILDPKLKDDLHSFRGSRNLIDHPAPNEREAVKRELQFPERMLMGARLLGEIESVRRKL